MWENRYCIICVSKDKPSRCFKLYCIGEYRSLAYSKVLVSSLPEMIDIHRGKAGLRK